MTTQDEQPAQSPALARGPERDGLRKALAGGSNPLAYTEKVVVDANLPTDRQAVVLNAIVAYWRDNGRPPSLRDIALACGIASTNGVMSHLNAMLRKGLIEMPTGQHGPKTTARAIWPAGLRQRISELLAEPQARRT